MSAADAILGLLARGPAPLQAIAAEVARVEGGEPPSEGWGPVAAHLIDRLAMAGAVAGPDREWRYRLAASPT